MLLFSVSLTSSVDCYETWTGKTSIIIAPVGYEVPREVHVRGFTKQNYFLQTDATSVSRTAGDQRKLRQPHISSRHSLEP